MRRVPRPPCFPGVLAAVLVLLCLAVPSGRGGEAEKKPEPLPPLPGEGWTPLFDGKTLKGWKIEEDGELAGRGEVGVKDGAVHLKAGMPFTAIKCLAKVPRNNYELACDAQRLSGFDIFCGLTFPVGRGHVTLVLGGWGDTVVGLSNVDGENAANNETTRAIGFENERWVRVRVRVTTLKIEAWINKDKVVDLKRVGRRFDVYPQLEPLRPCGFFSWRTHAALRNIQLRRIEVEALPPLPGKGWAPLFDGKSLEGWKVVAEGEKNAERMVRVADGAMLCQAGFELVGVAYRGEFPRSNYEVAVDAMRVAGDDFFCGMTFPIGKQAATLIVGGWGGTVVGLSNVDTLNAAENETTRDMTFKTGQWYRIRLRVTDERVQAWINKERVIDQPRKGHQFAVWLQQEAYLPFGLNAWQTQAALKNIVLRRLGKGEEPRTKTK